MFAITIFADVFSVRTISLQIDLAIREDLTLTRPAILEKIEYAKVAQ